MTDRHEYDGIKALNYSTLKLMDVSPAYLRHRMEHPEEDTDKPAYVSGRAVHCSVLEPKEFGSRYVVMPKFENCAVTETKMLPMPDFGDLRKKAGKEKKTAWLATLPSGARVLSAKEARDEWISTIPDGVEIISQDDYDMSLRCRDAVFDNDTVRGYLRGAIFETTVRWDQMGIQCKGRIDALTDRVIDLKTTRRSARVDVERDLANYDYHAQLAWYHDGAVKTGLIDGTKMPVAIVVHASHKSDFVDVACFEMVPPTLELGRMHYERWLFRYVGCLEENWWPGMAETPVQWELPHWKAAQYEEF